MKSIKDIRTAVIGVGSMGQNHARVFSEISNLVAVSDINEVQGREVAKRFGVKWYADYRQLIEKVDAVSIAVPTFLHLDIAKAFLCSGINILVEKPLAASLSDSQEILSLAQSTGINVAVGHVERHNTVVSYSKKEIDSGRWGEIITLSSRRFSNFPERISDVGVLFDLAIHDVDIIRYLAGTPVNSVFATGGKALNTEYEDYATLLMIFEDGKMGLCEANWLTPMKVRELSVTTTSHHIILDYLNQHVDTFSSTFGEVKPSNLFQPPMATNHKQTTLKVIEPLKTELIDFLNSTISKKRPLVDAFDGLEAVRIVEAATESIHTGSVVNL